VVSDKSWVETLVKIGDKLFPGVDVKYFSFDEKDSAIGGLKIDFDLKDKGLPVLYEV
jgi:hypothetical protein